MSRELLKIRLKKGVVALSICILLQLAKCFTETNILTCANCIYEQKIPCNPKVEEWYCCAEDEVDKSSEFCNRCYESPQYDLPNSPCFSTNINCLTETSYIKLDSEHEKSMSSVTYGLKKGEICRFKFVLPSDTTGCNWRGVHLTITKAESVNYFVSNHRYGIQSDSAYMKEYEYSNSIMDGTYKLGGGDINEVILTAVATEENPVIEFTFKEGWVTLLSRQMFYIVCAITGLTIILSVAGFTYYVVKYVKPWISVLNMINSLFGRPMILTDEESDFQTRPSNYQQKDTRIVYEKANLHTQSFDVE